MTFQTGISAASKSHAGRRRRFFSTSAAYLSLVLLLGVVMLVVAWVGYVGTDDYSYVRGAFGWLNQFPYVGEDHWALRHTVVIPVAVSLAMFGLREGALGLPSALLFLLLLAVNYHYLERYFGARFALLSSIFTATTPLFVVQATFPQDVIVHVFAVSVSFWLFYSAVQHDRPGKLMFAAGVAAAFGWLTLETTAALLLFYALLFLIGFGVPRRYYWIMALGFTLVVGIEVGYFTLLTGDPLYRYRIDLVHDTVDRFGNAAAALKAGRTLNLEGNLTVNPFLEPFATLLLNQEFGLLFWAYVPAAAWAWWTKETTPNEQRLLRSLIGVGLVWMVFVSLNVSGLYIVPRYYAPFTWSATIIVAYWVQRFLFVRWRWLGVSVGLVLLGINALCLYVENKNPLFAERALVKYLSSHQVTVYTDPLTLRRAKLLLEFEGVPVDRIRSEVPPPGSVFYVNRKSIDQCKLEGHKCKWSWKAYLPQNGWIELERVEPREKVTGPILRAASLDKLIPKEIFERLDRPNPGGIFYSTS
jgi:4-amino-4-deoxy-L-arabinose transferase-like glycosyltransferase